MATPYSLLLLVLLSMGSAAAGHDYGEALSKSILFYEAQRSGKLPATQTASWRADSGLHDGFANGVDLIGGYYDAGDNVKFGLPMAYTITTLSWSVIEYGKQLANNGELGYAMEAIQWGTDYLLKAHREPNVLYGEVGDGNSDHYCWQRPEDMTTPRQAYKIDTSNPGSDLAGETAAAMAAASIVFKQCNPDYANELLSHVKQVDYILGDNPRATSYMVGYGPNYPRQVHHRASSIVSYKEDPSFVSCKGGYATWFDHQGTDPNVLVGAIVGGPDHNDNFADARDNYEQTEPVTYNNGPMVGILARLQGGNTGDHQLLPVTVPKPGSGSGSSVPTTVPKPKPKLSPAPKQSSTLRTFPQKDVRLAISQKLTSSWSQSGNTYYRYAASITNRSPHQTLTAFDLSIQELYGPLWGLSKPDVNNLYSFPKWLKSLPPGKSMDFVYIQAAPPAIISLPRYHMI